jgi:hypothetical protein
MFRRRSRGPLTMGTAPPGIAFRQKPEGFRGFLTRLMDFFRR